MAAAGFAGVAPAVVAGRVVAEDVLAVAAAVPAVVAVPAAAVVVATIIRGMLASHANHAGNFKISVSKRVPQPGSRPKFVLIIYLLRRRAYGRTHKL